jgi:hypothetical protein
MGDGIMIELPTGHIQKGIGGKKTMRRIVAILMAVLLASSLTSASTTGGVDKDPVVEETVFTSITHTSNTHDGGTWSIDFALNSGATDNGTTFTLTTQQCTNDGVCDPPESRELVDGEQAGTFSSSVVAKDDHSYVNWRLRVTYPDSEEIEKLPAEGFYKSWSDCWHYEGAWGGDGCNDDGAEEPALPAISAALGIITIAAAAITRRQ